MGNPLKVTAFAAAIAVSFAAAYGVGEVVGPLGERPHTAAQSARSADRQAQNSGGSSHADPVGGLRIADGGYRLDLDTPRVSAGRESELRFTVRDAAGRPVTEYRREHGKELHLVLASRDLGTYRHLHPARAADGTWSVHAALPAAGDHRLFADFTPAAKGAESLTLGADLAVSGNYRPLPLPRPSAVATTDGYTVTLRGALRPGETGDLELSVSRDGRPVDDLEPYLEAYGHLVALRSGDLAYLHVHPGGEPGDGRTRPGPVITFTATAPSAGAYRLFLDFKHEGKVHTAAFTVVAKSAVPGEAADEHTDGTTGHTEGPTEHDEGTGGHPHP